MIQIIPAATSKDFEIIEKLAWEILPEHYAPYLPDEHTRFFLKTFQTIEKIQDQVKNNFHYYLLLDQSQAVGYLGISIDGSALELSKLYILKSHRSKGLGQLAMQKVDSIAQQEQISKMDLIVNRQNAASIKFYEKRGFCISEELVHHFENGMIVENYKMTKFMTET